MGNKDVEKLNNVVICGRAESETVWSETYTGCKPWKDKEGSSEDIPKFMPSMRFWLNRFVSYLPKTKVGAKGAIK